MRQPKNRPLYRCPRGDRCEKAGCHHRELHTADVVGSKNYCGAPPGWTGSACPKCERYGTLMTEAPPCELVASK